MVEPKDALRFLPLRAAHFHILLSMVEGAAHGYGMRRAIDERTDGRIVLAAGTLYETLQRLERQGLIRQTERPEGMEDASSRWRFYELEPLGREVLQAEVRRLESDLAGSSLQARAAGLTMPTAVVRVLMRLLPRDFRDEYGADLEAFWTAQEREPRYRGVLGRLRLWFHLFKDTAMTGVSMRLRSDGSGDPTEPDPRRRWTALGSDLRFVVRSLTRSPLYTLIAVATLALGVGATTSLFSVVDSILLRPLPFPESDRLVQVERVDEDGVPDQVSWPDYVDWRDQVTGLTGLAAYTGDGRTLGWDDQTELLDGARVSANYFDVMQVAPQLGRTFTADEDRFDGASAIIISHGLWQTRLGGVSDVLERTVVLEGETVPIVGVMPPGFQAPFSPTEFWTPLQDDALLASVGLPTGTRTLSFLDVVGRLGNAELPVVQGSLPALAARVDEEVGRSDADPVQVRSLQDAVVGDVGTMLWFLLAAVGLVLLVACANVAGLSLSRTATRNRELAVRSALGASSWQLFRLVLAECAVLGLLAAVFGILVAVGLTQLVVSLAPPELPRVDEVSLGLRALGVAGAVGGLSALLFGLGPAIVASRMRLTQAMASGSRGSSASASALRPQRLLVMTQVAVSVVLLSAAALLANSFGRLLSVERGFDTRGILVATINPPSGAYGTAQQIDAFYGQLLERVRAIPGVASATSTYSPPLAGNEFLTSVLTEHEPDEAEAHWVGTVIVRDDYFATTGTDLLSGRMFEATDELGSPPVAIVNESMAEALWPGQDPIGQRFRFAGGLSGSADSFDRAFFPDESFTVVGVAGDVRRTQLSEPPRPEYYRPHRQITWVTQYVMVRSDLDTDRLIAPLRAAVRELDSRVPDPTIETLADTVHSSLAAPRFRMVLLVGFALLTGLLAMVGLYAVMSMTVARRTREMGVRLALGASPGRLLTSVMAGGGRLVVVGLVAGLVAAVLATRLISSMLFEVSTTDPLTYGAVLVSTAAVALLACYGPARRASRVDPATSLRTEV